MSTLIAAEDIHKAGSWLANNQDLLMHYVFNILAALVTFLIGAFIAKVIPNKLYKIMELRHIDRTIAEFLSTLARYIILTITLIAVLGQIGVQTTSIIAVIGAAGLAVGLSLQGSLSNFAAGVILVAFRPFRIGEQVEFGGAVGTVHNIDIFFTTLRTSDGNLITVPNNKIITNNIINMTRNPYSRTSVTISVPYTTNIDKVKKILADIIATDEKISLAHQSMQEGINERESLVRLDKITTSSLIFIVCFWTKNENSPMVYWSLMEKFKKVLDENQINLLSYK